jgi:hypothetical protein
VPPPAGPIAYRHTSHGNTISCPSFDVVSVFQINMTIIRKFLQNKISTFGMKLRVEWNQILPLLYFA